ncbi:MAG TPA: sulfurtransferase [Candidatus Limnocylindrales bacterium]
MSGFPRPENLATPEWLAENLGRPDLRVIDVRWRTDGTASMLYRTGHVPGAIHLDWRESVAQVAEGGTAFLLASPDLMAAAMSRAGIGDGTSVVVYDDTQGYYASRVWWSLRAYGYEAARVLEGGWREWVAGGHPVVNGVHEAVAAAFTPRAQVRYRLTLADVRGMLGAAGVQLLDARGPAEYHGLEGEATRLGHIPGAVNVPAAALNRPGTQLLREPAELESLLRAANVTRNRRLVCYDAAGVAATRLAFVLTLLGHEDVAVYDGGWSEWGERFDLLLGR